MSSNVSKQYYSKPIDTYRQQPHKLNTRKDSYRPHDYDQDYTENRPRHNRHAPQYNSQTDKRYPHTYSYYKYHDDPRCETDDNDRDAEQDYVFYYEQHCHNNVNKPNYRQSQTEPDTDSDDAEQTDTDKYNRDFPPLPPPRTNEIYI